MPSPVVFSISDEQIVPSSDSDQNILNLPPTRVVTPEEESTSSGTGTITPTDGNQFGAQEQKQQQSTEDKAILSQTKTQSELKTMHVTNLKYIATNIERPSVVVAIPDDPPFVNN